MIPVIGSFLFIILINSGLTHELLECGSPPQIKGARMVAHRLSGGSPDSPIGFLFDWVRYTCESSSPNIKAEMVPTDGAVVVCRKSHIVKPRGSNSTLNFSKILFNAMPKATWAFSPILADAGIPNLPSCYFNSETEINNTSASQEDKDEDTIQQYISAMSPTMPTNSSKRVNRAHVPTNRAANRKNLVKSVRKKKEKPLNSLVKGSRKTKQMPSTSLVNLPMNCGLPPEIPFAVVVAERISDGFRKGKPYDWVRYGCQPGYYMEGSGIIVCVLTGRWMNAQEALPVCKQGSPPASASPTVTTQNPPSVTLRPTVRQSHSHLHSHDNYSHLDLVMAKLLGMVDEFGHVRQPVTPATQAPSTHSHPHFHGPSFYHDNHPVPFPPNILTPSHFHDHTISHTHRHTHNTPPPAPHVHPPFPDNFLYYNHPHTHNTPPPHDHPHFYVNSLFHNHPHIHITTTPPTTPHAHPHFHEYLLYHNHPHSHTTTTTTPPTTPHAHPHFHEYLLYHNHPHTHDTSNPSRMWQPIINSPVDDRTTTPYYPAMTIPPRHSTLSWVASARIGTPGSGRTCGPPPPIPDTAIIGASLHTAYDFAYPGDWVQYECPERFSLSSADTVICMADGRWMNELGTLPLCIPPGNCPPPPTYPLSTVDYISLQPGAKATYHCSYEKDYAMVGRTNQIYCQRNGTWTGADFECLLNSLPMGCHKPPIIPYGKIVREYRRGNFGWAVGYECDNVPGEHYIWCHPYRGWNTPPDCPPPVRDPAWRD